MKDELKKYAESKWLNPFRRCNLCSWTCNVDRISGERGVCRIGLPEVAYTSLSQATGSFTVTLLGCSFRCAYCNAYRLSQYPDVGWFYRGFVEPEVLAIEALEKFENPPSTKLEVSSISFTGGEPTISWPYVEAVVNRVKAKKGSVKIGLATNGFASESVMRSLIKTVDWISFEINAFDGEVHTALTGAPVEPVLKNAKLLVTKGRDKIRVVRTVVIPGINDGEVELIAEFLASLDTSVPYMLMGFRPNFILYFHPGPSKESLNNLVGAAKERGLKNVSSSGWYPQDIHQDMKMMGKKETYYKSEPAKLAASYLNLAGCNKRPRLCGTCVLRDNCPAMLWRPWSLQYLLKNDAQTV